MFYSSVVLFSILASVANADPVPGPLLTITTAADSSNQAAWWNPLDEYGGYSWAAYSRNPPGGSTSNNEVMIVRRSLSDGSIVRDCVKASSGSCAVFLDDIGHNNPSIAVDGDGFIHVFTSMHNEKWKYFRSSAALSSTTIVNRSSELPDQNILFTYPVLKRDLQGDLWLMIRGEVPGETARGGYLYKYTTLSKTWSRVSRWAYASGYSVYPDDIQFSSDGDVHLQWEWSKYPASAVRHEGSYVRYRPLSNTFRSASGATVSLPITQSSADIVFQPLTSGETYANDINASPGPAFQSAKLALYERGGSVHIQHAYRFKNSTNGFWQVRRATGAFGTPDPWSRTVLYDRTETTAGLGITHDGDIVRIYYCRAGNSTFVLENSGSGWANTALAPVSRNRVERLQAILRPDGTDILYLGAPTNINSSTGSVYLLTVGGR
jgi:hypothetical protein